MAGILIIEDDVALARAYARVIGAIREHVRTGGLDEARAQYGARPRWTGMIVDQRLELPDGTLESGLDFLAEVRAQGDPVPALVVSGHVDRELQNRAHALGAWCLPKPFEPAQVELFLARALVAERCPDAPLRTLLQSLVAEWGLSPREAELLGLSVVGVERAGLPERMGITNNTVKKYVRSLLIKAGGASLEALAKRVLRRYFAPEP